VTGFILSYHRRSGELTIEQFTGDDSVSRAASRRLELERERTDADVEIASLFSDSLESLQKTHSRYFRNFQPA
jgi:hypothetical protein